MIKLKCLLICFNRPLTWYRDEGALKTIRFEKFLRFWSSYGKNCRYFVFYLYYERYAKIVVVRYSNNVSDNTVEKANVGPWIICTASRYTVFTDHLFVLLMIPKSVYENISHNRNFFYNTTSFSHSTNPKHFGSAKLFFCLWSLILSKLPKTITNCCLEHVGNALL